MDYNARFYSPLLGKFVSADIIIPDPRNVLAWDRYGYAYNNVIRNNDPSGHVIWEGGGAGVLFDGHELLGYIYQKSESDADFLVNLYGTNYLPGDSVKERTDVILNLTYSAPYQHFSGQYGDSGFKAEYQDGADQVGHFLTAVRLGRLKGEYLFMYYLVDSASIGHEMISDNVIDSEGLDDVNSVLQFAVGFSHPKVHNLFETENYEEILNYYDFIDPERNGNSVVDLNLTKAGFIFSDLIVNENISNKDAAIWLRENLCNSLNSK